MKCVQISPVISLSSATRRLKRFDIQASDAFALESGQQGRQKTYAERGWLSDSISHPHTNTKAHFLTGSLESGHKGVVHVVGRHRP